MPQQESFVLSNAVSLAQAYEANQYFAQLGEGEIAVPYAIYCNKIMVGFAMYGYFPPGDEGDAYYSSTEHHYYFWRLLIDKNYQGKGIGKEAIRQVMEKIKLKPYGAASYCYVSYVPENIASKAAFTACGFEEDGRIVDGELVARYKL